MKAASESNPSRRSTAKLLLNSLYGRMGMHEIESRVKIIPTAEAGSFLKKMNWKEFINMGEYSMIRYTGKLDPELEKLIDLDDFKESQSSEITAKRRGVPSSVAIVITMSAYARINLSPHLNNPDNPCVYSDTDSGIFKKPLDPQYIGKELGKFKLEHKVDYGILISPKTYGLKYKDPETGKEKLKLIAKGIGGDKMTFEDYEKLLAGQDVIKEKIYFEPATEQGSVKIYTQPFTIKGLKQEKSVRFFEAKFKDCIVETKYLPAPAKFLALPAPNNLALQDPKIAVIDNSKVGSQEGISTHEDIYLEAPLPTVIYLPGHLQSVVAISGQTGETSSEWSIPKIEDWLKETKKEIDHMSDKKLVIKIITDLYNQKIEIENKYNKTVIDLEDKVHQNYVKILVKLYLIIIVAWTSLKLEKDIKKLNIISKEGWADELRMFQMSIIDDKWYLYDLKEEKNPEFEKAKARMEPIVYLIEECIYQIIFNELVSMEEIKPKMKENKEFWVVGFLGLDEKNKILNPRLINIITENFDEWIKSKNKKSNKNISLKLIKPLEITPERPPALAGDSQSEFPLETSDKSKNSSVTKKDRIEKVHHREKAEKLRTTSVDQIENASNGSNSPITVHENAPLLSANHVKELYSAYDCEEIT